LVGAFVVTFGLEGLRGLGDYRLMVYGLLLVLFVTFAPHGLAQLRRARPQREQTATQG